MTVKKVHVEVLGAGVDAATPYELSLKPTLNTK